LNTIVYAVSRPSDLTALHPKGNFPCSALKGFKKYKCEHGTIAKVPLRCRNCYGCIGYKMFKRATRIKNHMAKIGLVDFAFLTLTTAEKPEWSEIMRAWDSLRKWLMKNGFMGEYVMVKEEGELNGMRHLHIIYRWYKYLPHKELSLRWRSRKMGTIVYITKVKPTVKGMPLMEYLSKYLAKGAYLLGVRKAFTASKNWPKLPESQTSGLVETFVDTSKMSTKTSTDGVVIYDAAKVTLATCECFGDLSGLDWIPPSEDRGPPEQLGLRLNIAH